MYMNSYFSFHFLDTVNKIVQVVLSGELFNFGFRTQCAVPSLGNSPGVERSLPRRSNEHRGIPRLPGNELSRIPSTAGPRFFQLPGKCAGTRICELSKRRFFLKWVSITSRSLNKATWMYMNSLWFNKNYFITISKNKKQQPVVVIW